jgi:hypothetical protein
VSGLFAEIRAAAARVARRARSVHIDEAALAALAKRLLERPPAPPQWDPETHHVGTAASRLAYVVTLDAINFGSGWFPALRKRPGRSGYYTVAMGLKDRFDAHGSWGVDELRRLTPADVAGVLGQELGDPDVVHLLTLFARALNDLGALLADRHRGRFEGVVEEARGSAERLVRELTRMPLYRDLSEYEDFDVPFYKRAQITVADLAIAFDGRGPGRFDDLDELTCFADNLVPHVLRMEGVLRYDPDLASHVDSGALLEAGSPDEVEIRAVGLHAVERLVAAIRAGGGRATAHEIDMALWQHGQRPEMKAQPRHRARCPYY